MKVIIFKILTSLYSGMPFSPANMWNSALYRQIPVFFNELTAHIAIWAQMLQFRAKWNFCLPFLSGIKGQSLLFQGRHETGVPPRPPGLPDVRRLPGGLHGDAVTTPASKPGGSLVMHQVE